MKLLWLRIKLRCIDVAMAVLGVIAKAQKWLRKHKRRLEDGGE